MGVFNMLEVHIQHLPQNSLKKFEEMMEFLMLLRLYQVSDLSFDGVKGVWEVAQCVLRQTALTHQKAYIRPALKNHDQCVPRELWHKDDCDSGWGFYWPAEFIHHKGCNLVTIQASQHRKLFEGHLSTRQRDFSSKGIRWKSKQQDFYRRLWLSGTSGVWGYGVSWPGIFECGKYRCVLPPSM